MRFSLSGGLPRGFWPPGEAPPQQLNRNKIAKRKLREIRDGPAPAVTVGHLCRSTAGDETAVGSAPSTGKQSLFLSSEPGS